MRISAFELECIFKTHFTLAEVLNGQACALRLLHVQNVRGNENSWLNLSLYIDGKVLRRKSIRKLPVGDTESAARYESEITGEMKLPADTTPGQHLLRMEITGINTSHELLEQITVLPYNFIPTDFLRAPLLPAYIQESDDLRTYAASTLQRYTEPDAATVAQCLYNALLEKKLVFHPVGSRQYPDCQRIAALSHVLQEGGCCAELSLLFASLLRNVGQDPVLLLFEDHMAVGCFLQQTPDFSILTSPEEILALEHSGELLLFETTAVCKQHQLNFEAARKAILQRLEICRDGQYPCILINVRRILTPAFRLVPADTVRLKCSNCHYTAEVSLQDQAPVCKACGQPLQQDTPPQEPQVFSQSVQYVLQRGGASVLRIKASHEETIRIMPVWQGHSVVSINDHAFAQSDVSSVALPDSLCQIGDYAFQGCKKLRRLILPDSLTQLGTGAFRDSSLQEIRLPSSIQRIPRLAFANCSDLSIVTVPEGILFIDEKAFDGCCSLHSVTVPASVRQIAHNAFPAGCELILMSQTTKVL